MSSKGLTRARLFISTVFIFFALAAPKTSSAIENTDLTLAGDILQLAIPIGALSASYFLETPEGKPTHKDFIKSFGYGLLTVHGLKIAVSKKRPDNSNFKSFPSGHTFAAFSGAAFIQTRFGSWYGVPSYLLAGLVGHSRVKGEAHFADDVLAGASIAVLFNQYFAADKYSQVYINAEDGGMQVGIKAQLDAPMTKSKYKKQFSLFMGPAFLSTNSFYSKNSSVFDTQNQDHNKNLVKTATTNFSIESKKGIVELNLLPLELILRKEVSNLFTIDGTTFNNNELVNLTGIQYDFDIEYLKPFVDGDKFWAAGGLGAYLHYSDLKIESEVTPTKRNTLHRTGAIGYLSAKAKYKFSSRSAAIAKLSGYDDASTKYLKARLAYDYKLNKKWTLAFLGQYFERKLSLNSTQISSQNVDITNSSSYNLLNVGIRYNLD